MPVDFHSAAADFVQLVDRVPRERLDGPGLGEWTLRELIGHTARAISTVSAYLELPAPPVATVHSAAEYLEVVLRQQGDDEAIMLRSRAAGAALRDEHLAAELEALVGEAAQSVAAAGPARLVSVGGGQHPPAIRLDHYLRTRVFELTVHGLDIADAAGIDWQPAPAHVLDALHLAALNASARGMGEDALRLLTGRRPDAGLADVLRAGR